ncbi:mitochondrial transcription rescue factor 1 [Drosophila tropicalis]|uniref:mitochondrial transcription rescue factor 1 n=1 Tax=Drosophila tropicalis TaxID=46794 RepID=UPI0035ABC16B
MLRRLRQITKIGEYFLNTSSHRPLVRTQENVISALYQQQVVSLHASHVALKYNKKSSRASEDLDSDDEANDEFRDERDSKVVKANVNSLRADLLLKSGLGMARNKVELHFYESKIRVNGKKLQKRVFSLMWEMKLM